MEIELRDCLVSAALVGLLATGEGSLGGPVEHAGLAYKYADAMLAARKVNDREARSK